MVIAAPLGLGSAIYLSEYASPRVRRIAQADPRDPRRHPVGGHRLLRRQLPLAELVQRFSDSAQTFSLAAAGLGVGILTVPLIASVSEDAMRSVPNALREASYGLGAKKLTTCTKVVLPAAVSGLVAAFILAIVPGHRRDDGRAPRRRLGQRRASTPTNPLRGGPHHDRGHRLADPGHRRRR